MINPFQNASMSVLFYFLYFVCSGFIYVRNEFILSRFSTIEKYLWFAMKEMTIFSVFFSLASAAIGAAITVLVGGILEPAGLFCYIVTSLLSLTFFNYLTCRGSFRYRKRYLLLFECGLLLIVFGGYSSGGEFSIFNILFYSTFHRLNFKFSYYTISIMLISYAICYIFALLLVGFPQKEMRVGTDQ